MSKLPTLVIVSLLGFILETGAESPPTEPPHSLDNFKQYFWHYFDWSWGYDDLLKNNSDPGIVLVSPFPSAILLGNFNENTFNLSDSGLNEFQNISSEIGMNTQNYDYFLKSLVQGGVDTKSRVYTSDENLLSRNGTTGLEQFGTDIEEANFEGEWWPSINDFVNASTRGTVDEFIPTGTSLFTAFYPWTSAIFVNTNYYKSSWTNSWLSLGDQLFYEQKEYLVPFMEAKGSFKFYSDSNYPAVAIITLQEGNKSLILIQPQMNVAEFAQSEELKFLIKNEVWKSWNTSTISNLQIPELKIESRLGFQFRIEKAVELTEILENIVCSNGTNNGTNLGHYMAPIFQSQSLTLNPDYFELSSATASSVNSLEKLEEFIHVWKRNDSTMAQNSSNVDDFLEIGTNADEGEPEVPLDTVRFNKPFVMFLHDEKLGPMHFTLVHSFYNFHLNGLSEKLPSLFDILLFLLLGGTTGIPSSRSENSFACE